MAFVLGVSGPSQSGKDTLADYLIQAKGWKGKVSFAGNLKEMCKAIFSLTEEDVNTQEGKRRVLPDPVEITKGNLGSIFFWMSQTHAHTPISEEAKRKVTGLVGTKLETPRRILQFVGTEICRELIPSYHVDVVRKACSGEGNWIITDVRYHNEADFVVDSLGGAVVRINRPSVEKDDSLDRSHISEVSMNSWSGFLDTIDNDIEGLPHFFNKIDTFLGKNRELWQKVILS